MEEEKNCYKVTKVEDWGYFVEESKNKEIVLCRSIAKELEESQKAFYDNVGKKLIICDVDKRFPVNSAGRVGSHERCLSKYLQNEKLNGQSKEGEIMYRSTKLMKGPARVSLWMEAFSPICRIQAGKINEAITDMQTKGCLDSDDLLHVTLIAHDCHEKFVGTPMVVKEKLKDKL